MFLCYVEEAMLSLLWGHPHITSAYFCTFSDPPTHPPSMPALMQYQTSAKIAIFWTHPPSTYNVQRENICLISQQFLKMMVYVYRSYNKQVFYYIRYISLNCIYTMNYWISDIVKWYHQIFSFIYYYSYLYRRPNQSTC